MTLFLRLAMRNVFRNRVRTLVALLSISAGCAALILNAGVVLNIFRELREDAIHGRLGHLQIYRRGYSSRHLDDPESVLLSPAMTSQALALARSNSHVLRVTRRREFAGLISNGDRRSAFMGVGVEPQDDAAFSRHTALIAGKAFSSEDRHSALAGLGLARKLGARPGDDLTLITTLNNGALNAIHSRLEGVFEGGLKEFDDWTIKLPLSDVEHLLNDYRTEQIVLLIDRTSEACRVQAELEDAFRRAGLDAEIRSWRDLALFHNQVVGLFGRELDFIRLIVCAIVMLGIANTIGMSIRERRVELATLRALGLQPDTVAVLLLLETVLTALIGGCLGVALGSAVASIATQIGIPYPSPPGSTRPFLGGIELVPREIVVGFAIAAGATLAAAAFPVWRTVRRPLAPDLRSA